MSIKLNEKGYSHARSAAESGDTTDAPWNAPAGSKRKENECLGVETDEPEGSAARFKYPVFSGGKLNWAGVHEAESRATQNGQSEIADACKKLFDMRKQKGKGMSLAADEEGHWVTIDDHPVFIGGSAGHVPRRLRAEAGAKRFSKAHIENHLIAHHEEMGGKGGYSASDEKWINSHSAGDPFTFHQKLPTEIKEFMAGRPALRKLFKVSNNASEAGGEDAFAANEQRYKDIAESVAGSRLGAAKQTARNSPDPEVRFLAAVHDNLPSGAFHHDTINASGLRVGDKFTIGGSNFRVAEDAHGYRVLEGGKDYPETPVDALKHLPIDKGSLRQGKRQTLEAAPFSDDALEPPASPLVLTLSDAGEGQAVPAGLEGYPTEVDGVPVYYRMMTIARAGKWTHRGTGEEFEITPARMDEWVRNTMALSAAGVEPFVPGQHRDKYNADDNFGYVKRIQRDGNELKALVALYGDDARTAAVRNGRSIYILKDARDAKGKVYAGETLAHLALVPNPALPDLGPTVKIAASADGATIIDVPVYEPSVSSPVRSHEMTPENAAKVRKAFGLGTDVPDNQLADKAAEKALALSAEVTAITAERNTLKAERETLNNRVLQLDASAKPLDPIVLSMFADNIAAKREMAVSSGAVTEAEMKGLDAILNDGEGKPSVLALSASGSDRKPLAFKLLDWVAKLSHNGLRTGNAVPRGATVATPALQLDADGKPQKELTPERIKELLSQTNTGRAILSDAAKK